MAVEIAMTALQVVSPHNIKVSSHALEDNRLSDVGLINESHLSQLPINLSS